MNNVCVHEHVISWYHIEIRTRKSSEWSRIEHGLPSDPAFAGNVFKDAQLILAFAVEFVCVNQSTSGSREREGREERVTTCPSLGHTYPWFIHNNDKVRSWACQPPWSLCWLYPHLAPLNGVLIYHKRQGDRVRHMKSHIKENGTLPGEHTQQEMEGFLINSDENNVPQNCLIALVAFWVTISSQNNRPVKRVKGKELR